MKPQDQSYPHAHPKYREKIQFVNSEDISPVLGNEDKQFIQ